MYVCQCCVHIYTYTYIHLYTHIHVPLCTGHAARCARLASKPRDTPAAGRTCTRAQTRARTPVVASSGLRVRGSNGSRRRPVEGPLCATHANARTQMRARKCAHAQQKTRVGLRKDWLGLSLSGLGFGHEFGAHTVSAHT